MEDLCRLSGLDSFWDWNLTWYTERPDLTRCFQQTVLVWSPCIYLWTCSPLYLLYLQLRAPGPGLPLSCLCCVKTAVAAILLCCCLVELLYIYTLKEEMHHNLVFLLGPLLHIISLVLAVCVIQVERLKGVGSSLLLFFFWLLTVLCSMGPLKVAVEQVLTQRISTDDEQHPVEEQVQQLLPHMFEPDSSSDDENGADENDEEMRMRWRLDIDRLSECRD
ncbi:multidrug resistance-associated protein 1 [Eucyclogobius newberryi]|uniref:multidrug resistance-associated protein 1 n=1 Tax=Eucyclogobius newberryi TaxID=166745 RepID=UPI003B5BEC65